MRGKRVMTGNVQDGILLAHDGLGIRLAAAFTSLGVSAWLDHPRVYVYSTIRSASYMEDNLYVLRFMPNMLALTIALARMADLFDLKEYKEQRCTWVYSRPVLIKTRNNDWGVNVAMLLASTFERFWRIALHSCDVLLTASRSPVSISPSTAEISHAS